MRYQIEPGSLKVIRGYGAKDVSRVWESVKLAVRLGTPLRQALDQLKRAQPGLFRAESG